MTRLIASIVLLFTATFATCGALAQTTQPAPAPHARQRVLVMPFAPVDDASAKRPGLGMGIQESLLADLAASRVDAFAPPAGAAPVATGPVDPRAALDEARRADADYVIFGGYQVLDPELRITGQVLNARQDEPALARLRATGTVHDLFRLEDRLTIEATQALGVPVPRDLLADQAGTPRELTPPDTTQQQVPSDQAQAAGPDNYSYPPYYGPTTYGGYDNYPYDYSQPYAYYPYSYPYYPDYYYYYPSVGFFFGGFNGHNHFDHFHNGFHNGFHGNFHGGFHSGFNGGFHGSSGFHSGGGFHGFGGGGGHMGGFGGGGGGHGGGGGGHR